MITGGSPVWADLRRPKHHWFSGGDRLPEEMVLLQPLEPEIWEFRGFHHEPKGMFTMKKLGYNHEHYVFFTMKNVDSAIKTWDFIYISMNHGDFVMMFCDWWWFQRPEILSKKSICHWAVWLPPEHCGSKFKVVWMLNIVPGSWTFSHHYHRTTRHIWETWWLALSLASGFDVSFSLN